MSARASTCVAIVFQIKIWTPLERLLATDVVSVEQRLRLEELRAATNPRALRQQIYADPAQLLGQGVARISLGRGALIANAATGLGHVDSAAIGVNREQVARPMRAHISPNPTTESQLQRCVLPPLWLGNILRCRNYRKNRSLGNIII
jgi:hypothetical protein